MINLRLPLWSYVESVIRLQNKTITSMWNTFLVSLPLRQDYRSYLSGSP